MIFRQIHWIFILILARQVFQIWVYWIIDGLPERLPQSVNPVGSRSNFQFSKYLLSILPFCVYTIQAGLFYDPRFINKETEVKSRSSTLTKVIWQISRPLDAPSGAVPSTEYAYVLEMHRDSRQNCKCSKLSCCSVSRLTLSSYIRFLAHSCPPSPGTSPGAQYPLSWTTPIFLSQTHLPTSTEPNVNWGNEWLTIWWRMTVHVLISSLVPQTNSPNSTAQGGLPWAQTLFGNHLFSTVT